MNFFWLLCAFGVAMGQRQQSISYPPEEIFVPGPPPPPTYGETPQPPPRPTQPPIRPPIIPPVPVRPQPIRPVAPPVIVVPPSPPPLPSVPPPPIRPITPVPSVPPPPIRPITPVPSVQPTIRPPPPPFIPPSTQRPTFPSPQPPTSVVPSSWDIYEVMPAGEMAQLLSIDVQCAMTSMKIRITFDRPYNGVIYSKGFFSDPQCHYVPFGSNQAEYDFEVTLDRCGTQFIDNLGSGGTAFLENILLLQNEESVQEMWDVARRVQCTWQGQVDQSVASGFQVDMLDTVKVAYSGDDISAELDIQLGRGPFAPRAQGLLKIGEQITAVIYVFGSGDMDIQVRDCVAHDGDRRNSLQLTDSLGCITKKKLMGAWQFTRETGATGASVIAYAFMQSFRFPDKEDVYFECGIEVCKGSCVDHCPEYPAIDLRSPAIDLRSGPINRKKRNVDLKPRDARLLQTFRVVGESVDGNGNGTLLVSAESNGTSGEVCMTLVGFILGLIILLTLLLFSVLGVVVMWIRVKTLHGVHCPDNTQCKNNKLAWFHS